MIYLYSGTPGSGKSLHSARDIYQKLSNGGNVIANFPVNIDKIKNLKGEFYYIDNADISVDFFIRFSEKYHVLGKENQTLVILDECSVLFNPRDFKRNDRSVWLSFFAQHRKYGFNFILISQMDRQIDRQIRGCIEVEVKHRKANNYKLFWILPFPLFLAIDTWYAGGGFENKLNSYFFLYRKKYGADFYNSFMLFDGRLKSVKSDKLDQLIKDSRLTNGDAAGGDPLASDINLKESIL
jgi:hypothetical protein